MGKGLGIGVGVGLKWAHMAVLVMWDDADVLCCVASPLFLWKYVLWLSPMSSNYVNRLCPASI